MRVITGIAKGKRLVTPDGRKVRPTPERVKEGLFSSLQFDIEGRRVLDLFAGSGQLGIESLSRGAQAATFVDYSELSINIVKTNIEITGFQNSSKVVRSSYDEFCKLCKEKYDIVFLDPPYASGLLIDSIKAVIPLISDYGSIVCEHPSDVVLDDSYGDFVLARSYKYGRVIMSVFRKGVSHE